jgi:hypothetical protein
VPDPFENGHNVVVQHHSLFILRKADAFDLLQLQLGIAAWAVAPEQDAVRT